MFLRSSVAGHFLWWNCLAGGASELYGMPRPHTLEVRATIYVEDESRFLGLGFSSSYDITDRDWQVSRPVT